MIVAEPVQSLKSRHPDARILIIDDHPGTASKLNNDFSSVLNTPPVVVNSAQDARVKIAELRLQGLQFDAIVCDVVMEVETGIQFLRSIVAENENAPAIVVNTGSIITQHAYQLMTKQLENLTKGESPSLLLKHKFEDPQNLIDAVDQMIDHRPDRKIQSLKTSLDCLEQASWRPAASEKIVHQFIESAESLLDKLNTAFASLRSATENLDELAPHYEQRSAELRQKLKLHSLVGEFPEATNANLHTVQNDLVELNPLFFKSLSKYPEYQVLNSIFKDGIRKLDEISKQHQEYFLDSVDISKIIENVFIQSGKYPDNNFPFEYESGVISDPTFTNRKLVEKIAEVAINHSSFDGIGINEESYPFPSATKRLEELNATKALAIRVLFKNSSSDLDQVFERIYSSLPSVKDTDKCFSINDEGTYSVLTLYILTDTFEKREKPEKATKEIPEKVIESERLSIYESSPSLVVMGDTLDAIFNQDHFRMKRVMAYHYEGQIIVGWMGQHLNSARSISNLLRTLGEKDISSEEVYKDGVRINLLGPLVYLDPLDDYTTLLKALVELGVSKDRIVVDSDYFASRAD